VRNFRIQKFVSKCWACEFQRPDLRGVKRPEREAYNSLPYRPGLKIVVTSKFQHAFMLWCTFTLEGRSCLYPIITSIQICRKLLQKRTE